MNFLPFFDAQIKPVKCTCLCYTPKNILHNLQIADYFLQVANTSSQHHKVDYCFGISLNDNQSVS